MMGWSQFHQADQKKQGLDPQEVFARAQAYDYLMVKEIKPFVDRLFRTKAGLENTAVVGASSGAMVALWQLFIHPEVFSKAGALSGGFEYCDDLRKDWFKPNPQATIFLDCGDKGLDGKLLPATRDMDAFLQENGFVPGKNYQYFLAEGQDHGERFWATRVEKFLRLFFPVKR